MSKFQCDCGENSGHTNVSQCRANRQATHVMQSRQHQESLPTVRVDGKFVRFAVGDENNLPHGTQVTDGVIARW